MEKYTGGCLCGKTTYSASHPENPHLCSCTMCRKSSGAPTVAWIAFPLNQFKWEQNSTPGAYQSSERTQRLFCKACGGLLAALNKGGHTICITIGSLDNPNLIIPNNQHSYQEKSPDWWNVNIVRHSATKP